IETGLDPQRDSSFERLFQLRLKFLLDKDFDCPAFYDCHLLCNCHTRPFLSAGNVHTLYAESLAARIVNCQNAPVQPEILFRHLELCRQLGQKLINRFILPDADNRIESTGHPGIGDICGPLGQEPLVRCLDMGMRTDYRTDPAVEIPPERGFFGGGLGMEIDKDDLCRLGQGGDLAISRPERAFETVHEDAPLKVDHSDPNAARCRHDSAPLTRGPIWIVGRADYPFLFLEVLKSLLLVPDVISRGKKMYAAGKQLLCRFCGNSETAGCILAVGNHDIHIITVNQTVQFTRNRLPAGLSDNISDKENINGHTRLPWFRELR